MVPVSTPTVDHDKVHARAGVTPAMSSSPTMRNTMHILVTSSYRSNRGLPCPCRRGRGVERFVLAGPSGRQPVRSGDDQSEEQRCSEDGDELTDRREWRERPERTARPSERTIRPSARTT